MDAISAMSGLRAAADPANYDRSAATTEAIAPVSGVQPAALNAQGSDNESAASGAASSPENQVVSVVMSQMVQDPAHVDMITIELQYAPMQASHATGAVDLQA